MHGNCSRSIGTGDVTYGELKGYMARVNALDYVSQEMGIDAAGASRKVQEAVELVKALRSGDGVSRGVIDRAAAVIRGDAPQAGTASEAEFRTRAARSPDRILFNADMIDLGIDVNNGNAHAMGRIAKGENIEVVSRSASDRIIERKRNVVQKLRDYYRTELMPAAQKAALAQHLDGVLPLLKHETEPLFLLGGDEITLSVPRVFEELGLVPSVVGKLQQLANARVAVTRTGATLDGARGHERAMKAAEAGHDMLKKYEQLARDLRQRASVTEDGIEMRVLADYFEGLYTGTSTEGELVVNSGASVATDLTANHIRAQVLLRKTQP